MSAAMLTRWHYYIYIDAVMITRWRYCLKAVMITRWQYCLRVTMLTRWHYYISMEMVTGCVNWIVNVSNDKELWIARIHQQLQTAGKDNLIRKTGWGTTETETDRQKEGRRMQCFIKKGDKAG